MDGGRLDMIKTPKVERILLKQYNHTREYVTGTLCLTDRHLIFIEPTGAQETWVLHHHISSMEKLPLTTRGYPLIINTKTFQHLRLIIPRESDCVDIMDTIKVFSQPEHYSDLYAYQYKPKDGEIVKQTSGWALFDCPSEYARMGVPNQYWRATNLNDNYELCETYSSSLYLPATVDNSVITGSAKFRSKERLPVLSYYYKPTQSALCRCSQPLVGLTGRSAEDEQLLQAIINVNPNSDILHVVDTRPKVNAMANKAAGKGYETTDNYSNMRFEFFNIHNIHIMRESLQKMFEAVCPPNQTVSGMLSGLESSGWLKHIHLILEVAVFTAKVISEDKASVLIHCSDGWDRTAQTCALTCLLLDPYYRTLHGFMVLIEKEWLAFGHKMSIRSGHLAVETRETSPIMTQFLDCVWQVMVQYPTAFQFNEFFLVTLHDHLYSCQFGTFLGNNEKERLDMGFKENTYSLWGHVWAHLDDFINPLFSAQDRVIIPNTDIPQLSFWTGLYCGHTLKHQVCEMADEVTASMQQQNFCISEHIKFLENKMSELKKRLTFYKEKLQATNPDSRDVTDTSPDGIIDELKSQRIDDSDLETDSTGVTDTKNEDGPTDNSLNSTDEIPPTENPKTVSEGSNDTPTQLDVFPEERGSQRVAVDPTGCLSPTSYSTFKGFLNHTPDLNLPWQSMRSVSQCGCGMAFSYSRRKYHCSYCGVVVCGSCSSYQALPGQTSSKPQRVCKACFKLMRRRYQEEQLET
ncbi:myotubularin-related protein 6-like [Halichondria panicea]|uniref:myotubularin-related protein 6-like n=1 Tax=Halichondria panicea TaxID=6063 RepID=UPI00312B63FE